MSRAFRRPARIRTPLTPKEPRHQASMRWVRSRDPTSTLLVWRTVSCAVQTASSRPSITQPFGNGGNPSVRLPLPIPHQTCWRAFRQRLTVCRGYSHGKLQTDGEPRNGQYKRSSTNPSNTWGIGGRLERNCPICTILVQLRNDFVFFLSNSGFLNFISPMPFFFLSGPRIIFSSVRW